MLLYKNTISDFAFNRYNNGTGKPVPYNVLNIPDENRAEQYP